MSVKPQATSEITDLLQEKRVFKPSKAFKAQANVKDPTIYARARKNPQAFWESFAKQLHWHKKWKKVLEWNPPHAKWFVGGKLNVAYNCLDRHVTTHRKNKVALIWEGEPGETIKFTYNDLYHEVNRAGSMLRKLGIQKGDRVAIYMPMVPEVMIAMLACARVGAVHSVVFGGFSVDSLIDRINDAQAKLIITADGGYRRGTLFPLKPTADQAVAQCPSVKNVIVVKRGHGEVTMEKGRDHWWHELMAQADAHSEPEWVDSEDMFFVLYTSGSTGKPKGIVHTTGGYLTHVYATMQWVFDIKDTDVFWCTADVGWVTGHSYIVYGPLSSGATVVMYEGTPNYPKNDRFWRTIEKHKVTVFYTAPTAIRTFMKWGAQWPEACDLSSLRLLGTVGEPINPEAWIWYHENIGRKKCPIVDTWWQTETGGIMITPLPGITATKPGLATTPFPGIEADILNQQGERIEVGGGYLAIRKPWPGMLRGIFGDMERYVNTYWSKWDKGTYFVGDGAKRDKNGYFWILGRIDDVLNVSGHRIGTMEVEGALVSHPDVAESAVIGRAHDIKGQAVVAFVTLKEGRQPTPDKNEELKQHVSHKIGALARPEEIIFSAELPKTRSGKIMRRLLRDIAEGRALGDTTTLTDPGVVEGLKKQYSEEG